MKIKGKAGAAEDTGTKTPPWADGPKPGEGGNAETRRNPRKCGGGARIETTAKRDGIDVEGLLKALNEAVHRH
jgi:hypothetical protein